MAETDYNSELIKQQELENAHPFKRLLTGLTFGLYRQPAALEQDRIRLYQQRMLMNQLGNDTMLKNIAADQAKKLQGQVLAAKQAELGAAVPQANLSAAQATAALPGVQPAADYATAKHKAALASVPMESTEQNVATALKLYVQGVPVTEIAKQLPPETLQSLGGTPESVEANLKQQAQQIQSLTDRKGMPREALFLDWWGKKTPQEQEALKPILNQIHPFGRGLTPVAKPDFNMQRDRSDLDRMNTELRTGKNTGWSALDWQRWKQLRTQFNQPLPAEPAPEGPGLLSRIGSGISRMVHGTQQPAQPPGPGTPIQVDRPPFTQPQPIQSQSGETPTFDSEEEFNAAVERGEVQAGQRVIVNGQEYVAQE